MRSAIVDIIRKWAILGLVLGSRHPGTSLPLVVGG